MKQLFKLHCHNPCGQPHCDMTFVLIGLLNGRDQVSFGWLVFQQNEVHVHGSFGPRVHVKAPLSTLHRRKRSTTGSLRNAAWWAQLPPASPRRHGRFCGAVLMDGSVGRFCEEGHGSHDHLLSHRQLAAYSFHSSNVLPRTSMSELAVVPIRNVKHWSGQEPSEGKFTESQVFS